MLIEPTSDNVRAYRERYCIGIDQAKQSLKREAALAAIDTAETLADLKQAMRYIVVNSLA